MGRAPCCIGEHAGLKKGPWSHEEDEKLKSFLLHDPIISWRLIPLQAGLLRCGKSCRLRWMNYLRPDIRRGNFTPEEESLIIQLHAAIGNKWSVIASQLPGRTDNEIKNLWNTKLRKLLVLKGINPITHQPFCNLMLSDYVKQWVKSIKNMITVGISTPPSSSSLSNPIINCLFNSNTISVNSSSHHLSFPSFASLPLKPSLNEEVYRQPHTVQTTCDQSRFKTSYWVDENSCSYENFIDKFMLGDACLHNNLNGCLGDGFGDNMADPLLDRSLVSVTSAVNLEEGLKIGTDDSNSLGVSNKKT